MVIGGSDFPVEHINPLYGFYAAVARKDQQLFPKDGFQKDQALTRQEALKSMTIWAAFGAFEEHDKGSLEAGKFADFVILDKDIMTIPEAEIFGVKVLATYIGGDVVYSSN
jgi:predicted amidohydrolase YtcJ